MRKRRTFNPEFKARVVLEELTGVRSAVEARYPNLVQDLHVVRPGQVWVSDITYIRLAHEFAYLAVIMDVFTHSIRGWHLGRSLDQSLTLLEPVMNFH